MSGKKLIAQRPVLYLGRSYERGAVLPTQAPLMVEAWLRAGSAVWRGDGPPPERISGNRREAADSASAPKNLQGRRKGGRK